MIESRLLELDIQLPLLSRPAANYVPYVKSGNIIYISGQLPLQNGKLKYEGKVGEGVNVTDARDAARICALNILAQLKEGCQGDLNRVMRCIRLGGFVNATDDFKDQPLVINGASDLIVAIFGEQGRHARAAVGVNSLPFGAPVEIDAIFEVKE
jgi:enamine deaminase RidA (YjgF/YER057c/UK114 family)